MADIPSLSEEILEEAKSHLKDGAKTVDKQSVLQEVRKEHGGKEVLKHVVAPPKSVTALTSEIRAAKGGEETLKSALTVNKQELLQDVRTEKDMHLKKTPSIKEDIIKEALAERVEDEIIKIVPAIAEESIKVGKTHLKEGAKTVDKQSVLQEVRMEHGGKEVLKHVAAPPKSVVALTSEIRAAKGGEEKLKSALTVNKQELLQDVRTEKDMHLKTTPSIKEDIIKEALAERVEDEIIKIVPAIAEETIKVGKTHLKEGAKTVDKQAVLSAVRLESHATAENLRKSQTMDKQGLLSEVRSESRRKIVEAAEKATET